MTKALAYAALLMACLLHFPCAGQNLVPNPSFESYNNCPNSISGLEFSPSYNYFPTVQAWVNPLQKGSADYFNICASAVSGVKIPANSFGYQPSRTGSGYVGIIAWEGRLVNGNMVNQFGEYIQCRLTQPLSAGARYCVSFYVSSAIGTPSYNYVGIDKLGINFSVNKVSQSTGFTLSMSNSVLNTQGNFLTDTAGWMRVTANYTAAGGEEWLTLGWFDNGGVPSWQPVLPATPNPANNYRCYLYIDDISVAPAPAKDTVITVHDSTYCNPGGLNMNLYGNTPSTGEFLWNNGSKGSSIKVTDSGLYWCTGYSDCVTYIDSFRVRYEPAPLLNLGKELVNCENQPVTITANYPNTNYLWNTGAKTQSITVNKSGKYFLTINDKCGLQSDTVSVYIQPPTAPPPALDTTVCQFVIAPAITIPGTGIRWYTHAGGTFGSIHQPPIITRETGLYSLFVTQTVGKCESPMSPVTVKVIYTPHEEMGNKSVMCENDIKVIGTYETGVTYKWNNGATACCVLPQVEGLYQRAATNSCGSFIDSIWIYYKSCEECIAFPNAFTPVKGYNNNVFRPLLKCPVSEFSITIFNRWGNVVYRSNDVTEGWNGRYNFDWAPVGTYVYMAEFRAKDKLEKQVIRGNVTLLR